MHVDVDGFLINQEVEKLLIEKYGLDKDTSENIALDVEKILEENKECDKTEMNVNDNPKVDLCSEECVGGYETLNNDVKCVVAKHINGISLNDYEFLLEGIKGEIQVFDSKDHAKVHLLQQGLTEEDIHDLRFLDYEKFRNGVYEDVA